MADPNTLPNLSFSGGAPAAIGMANAHFSNGPSWNIDDLDGAILRQYANNGVLLQSYGILSNTTIDTDGELTIEVDADWDPLLGSVGDGVYWIIEDTNLPESEFYLLHDTDLGTAGVPYTGSFKRLGVLPHVKNLSAQAFTSAPAQSRTLA